MEFKELTLEEKYDRLFDLYALNLVTFFSLHKESGTIDKCIDWSLKIKGKMLPSGLGKSAFKLLKAVYMCTFQTTLSMSDIEVNRISDREVNLRFKYCPELVRIKQTIKKANLDLSPRFMCEESCKGITLELAKGFGIDGTNEFIENGCMWQLKLS